ncbi:MAG: molybdenum cofactor biosynthesis protein MoaE [Nitrospinae bacterium]|nr:molybdenum cofactor biosynthesis protein MoaE [Nitrospinota bacterium]
MAEVRFEDFDVGAEIRRLIDADRHTGAVVTFLGTARDLSRGKSVEKLEFEHYMGMAESELDQLEEETVKTFDILRCAIIHRIGEIGVGENIVLIVVTAMHRKAAFAACEWTIDQLKARVPIWKKEFSTDGEEWVEEHP